MDESGLSYLEIAAGKVADSMQLADDVIADFDAAGDLLGVEFLSATARSRESHYVALARSSATRERLLTGA